jgi:hypothetical protein
MGRSRSICLDSLPCTLVRLIHHSATVYSTPLLDLLHNPAVIGSRTRVVSPIWIHHAAAVRTTVRSRPIWSTLF